MEGPASFVDHGANLRAGLRRWLPLSLGLLLAGALIALLYSASTAADEHEMALAEQRRSMGVIALVRQLEATAARAETTLARYVISLEPNTGRLFQSQWRDAAGQLRKLAYVARRSDWQQDNVRQLQMAFNARGKRLSDIGLRTTYDQKVTALALFHQAGKTDDLKQMTSLLARISDAEEQRLRERSLAVSLAGDRTQRADQNSRLLGLVLLVCILFAIWIAQVAYNDRRNARRQADAEAERADRLEAAVAQRTAELQQANIRLKEEASEREVAENHLRQMHKMEAVGQLTGGIAHDFNNMLAVVVGGLELARRKLDISLDEAGRHIDNAMEGANRASALTRRLLAFSRSEPLLPSAVDADALITGMGDLIDRTIGDQIKVIMASKAEGWRIFVDQHQIENAILNLCVNARDAMDGRGTLTIETGQTRLAAGEVGECLAGDHVTLTVRDTGCGMTPEVLARVFEPFFTTKPVGRGTGLGLSQIFGFVRQSQGEIRIESEVGQGTAVHIYLPRRSGMDSDAKADSVTTNGQDDTRHPPTRILVVEDDPRVLNQTMSAIAELGHLPVACDHPSKVERLLRNHSDIGLIVSDVLMPDVTGPEMIQALPSLYAHIPVLFVTGYAGEIDGAQFGGHEVLRKPYTLAGLSRALSNALSGSPRDETAQAAE